LSAGTWSKIGRWSGWLALLFLIVSVVSGFAWDIRTSDVISGLSGGLLNRTVGSDLHTFILVPLFFALLLHIASRIKKLSAV
jgi:hypothetical protein